MELITQTSPVYKPLRKQRYALLDSIRGLTLINMVIYHAVWDLVYLSGFQWEWYHGIGAYVWQQSICWVFILLSGFCWPLGSKPLKRGGIVFAGGLIVSAVTIIFSPENKILFGILTLLGSCMLLMIPLDKWLRKIPASAGLLGSFFIFVLTRNVNTGYLGFGPWNPLQLPEHLYHGNLASYIGFTDRSFSSTDYFSLFPWLFLFITGYYAYHLFCNKPLVKSYLGKEVRPLSLLGRYSLEIYILHQPILYILLASIPL